MKKHSDNSSEQGIALLMALGFSALLTVMVMGFLTSTLIEHQAATATAAKTENTVISDSAIGRFFAEVSTAAELTGTEYYSSKGDVNASDTNKFIERAPDPGLFRFDNFVSRSTALGGFKYRLHGGSKTNWVSNDNDKKFSAIDLKLASWNAPTGKQKNDKDFSLALVEDHDGQAVPEGTRDENLRRMSLVGLYDSFTPTVSNRVTFTAGEKFTDGSAHPVLRTIYEYPIWTKNLKTRTAWGNPNWGYYAQVGETNFKATIPGYDLRFVQPEWRYVYKPITTPTQQKSGSQLRWSTKPIQTITGRYWYAVVPDAGRIHKTALNDARTSPYPRLGISPRELMLDKTLGDNLWGGMGTSNNPEDPEEEVPPSDSLDSGIPTVQNNTHALTQDQLRDIYEVVNAGAKDDMAIADKSDEALVRKVENQITSPSELEPVLADRYMKSGPTINAAKFYTYYLYNLIDFAPRSREEINEKYYVRAIKGNKVINRANTQSQDRPKRFNLAMPGNIKNDDTMSSHDEWESWVSTNLNNHGPVSSKWTSVLVGSYSWNEEGNKSNPSLYSWNDDSFYFRNLKGNDNNIMNQFRFLNLIGDDSENVASTTDARDIKTRRLQIAANLIDYNDARSTPSSDAKDWFSTEPTITGNEKTPYINEVNVSFITTSYSKGGNVTPVQHSLNTVKNTVKMFVDAELVNFFGDDVDFDETLYLYIDISGELDSKVTFKQAAFDEHWGSIKTKINPSESVDILDLQTSGEPIIANTFTAKKEVVAGESTTLNDFLVLKFTPNKGKTYLNSDAAALVEFELTYTSKKTEQSSATSTYSFKPEVFLKDFKINRMILTDLAPGAPPVAGTKFYDYARSISASSTNIDNFLIVEGAKVSAAMTVQKNITNEAPVVFEVNDARDNLYNNAWTTKTEPRLNTVVNVNNPQYPASTREAKNTASLPGDGQTDYHYVYPGGAEETVYAINGQPTNNPPGLLDYKIKNSPMVSPAELGLIHRAQPWQTIRLDRAAGQYNRPTSFSRDFDGIGGGGTTFEDGDGGILDFVYIGDPNSRTELININTRSVNIWRSLLYGVPFSDATKELGEYKFQTTVTDNSVTKYKLDKTLPGGEGHEVLGDIGDVTKIANKISEIISRQRLFFQARTDILRPLEEIPGSISEGGYTQEDSKLKRNLLDLALTESEVYNGGTQRKLNPKERGVIAGRILGITEAERYPKRFNMVMVTQNINDVGGVGYYSSGGSNTKDGNKVYLPVGEHDRSFVADSGNAGNAISKIGDSYTIRSCRIGEFDVMQNKAVREPNLKNQDELDARGVLYFDKITSQEKLLIRYSCTEDEKGYPVLKVISIDNLGK